MQTQRVHYECVARYTIAQRELRQVQQDFLGRIEISDSSRLFLCIANQVGQHVLLERLN